jgi:integrase/recombinase XerD
VRTRAAGRAEGLLPLYLAHLDTRRFSPSTKRLSRQALDRFFAHLKKSRVRNLRSTRVEHVTAFARALRTERSKAGGLLSEHTRAAFLSRVRTFFAFLEKRGLLITSPARGLVIPAVRQLPRCTLNPRMAEKLVNEPNPTTAIGRRDRAMLELLYGTGLRLKECSSLDLLDVDFNECTLIVRNGKGRKDRIVPIPARTVQALEVYIGEGRPDLAGSSERALLVSKYGRRLSDTQLRERVKQHAQAARLKVRVSPHSLRHAYATHLLQGGADVRHVQELLGHKRIETTALYTRVDVSDLKAMLKRSHPRERVRRRGQRR